MSSFIERLQSSQVDWQSTDESNYVFEADFEGEILKLRLNDFPDEPFCTIIRSGKETDIEPFPKTWTLPRHRIAGENRSE